MRGHRENFSRCPRARRRNARPLSRAKCLAFVGENGAGKSTLMKILAGAQPADSGEILIDGKAVHIDGPRTAEQLGIGMIYQEFNLVPPLNAIDNIVLGDEPVAGFFSIEESGRSCVHGLGRTRNHDSGYSWKSPGFRSPSSR